MSCPSDTIQDMSTTTTNQTVTIGSGRYVHLATTESLEANRTSTGRINAQWVEFLCGYNARGQQQVFIEHNADVTCTICANRA